jgi:cell division protein ZapA
VLAEGLSGRKTILSPNEDAYEMSDANGDDKMTDVSVTTVQIFGQEYKISGFEDKSYVQRVAGFVDERMRELSQASSSLSQERLAVLTALNIADELFQESKRSSEALSSVGRRADALIAQLDQCLLAER